MRSVEIFLNLIRIEDLHGAVKHVTICSFSAFLALLCMLMMLLDNSGCWKGKNQLSGVQVGMKKNHAAKLQRNSCRGPVTCVALGQTECEMSWGCVQSFHLHPVWCKQPAPRSAWKTGWYLHADPGGIAA